LNRTFWNRDVLAAGRAGYLHERGDQRLRAELSLQAAIRVQELFPPAQVVLPEGLEFGARANPHDVLVELIGWAKAFGVPRRNLAEHAAPVGFAENLDHEIQVTEHDTHTLLERRFGQALTGPQIVQRVLENPGIVEGPAPDAHASTTGV